MWQPLRRGGHGAGEYRYERAHKAPYWRSAQKIDDPASSVSWPAVTAARRFPAIAGVAPLARFAAAACFRLERTK
jgi:hypothetical protein